MSLGLMSYGDLLSTEGVDKFCDGCDHKSDPYPMHCKGTSVGAAEAEGYGFGTIVTDQERYAARGWCNCALVEGVRGKMTRMGFIPTEQSGTDK